MKKAILHIPHSSTAIPTKKGYLSSTTELKTEIIKLTDWYTADLYQHNEAVQIIAPFSRLFCDVERFPEDRDEAMAKFGMGMVYTTFDNGKILRKIDKNLKDKIFKQYYQKHHDKFLQKVEKMLKNNGQCLIIDCHSFSNIPFERDLDKTLPRPNIDIGIDSFHTPKKLLAVANEYFKNNGFSCKTNSPYAGAIVPLKYYKKDKRIQSIMIEVNRDLYLETNTNIKNKNYKKIKKILNGFIEEMISATANEKK
ncbi:MAG: N-formylglutamate amidohydrolase [Candidatus Azambacteria bacterium]|nr:N-formylglutamate amidohydrolase [Candidatus Azambacteria bacterium]